MVVDVHLDGLEVRHLVTLQRQWQQSWRINLGERAGTAAWQLLEQLFVEPREQRRHSLIDLVYAAELLVTQARHDPTLHDLHRRFGLGLVLWMPWPGRQDRSAIVAREVEHRVVATRLVAVGVGDHGLRVVRHDQLRNAADEGQRARRGLKPVLHRLVWRGAGIGIAGSAQGGYEDVGAAAICQSDGRAGVIDEQLLASPMHLAH